ncbi:unnamed protein product, partial [marine sediment metagenome]
MDVEKKIDRVLKAGNKSNGNKKKRTKRLLKLSPGFLILLAIGIGTAILVSSFSVLYLQLDGDIETTGNPVDESEILWDGEQLVDETTFEVVDAIGVLDPGDVVVVPHTIQVVDDYDMYFDVDVSAMEFPSDSIYYGFYFEVLDAGLAPLVVPLLIPHSQPP